VYVLNAFPLQDWAWRPVDLKLGDVVSSIWVNFAKSGSPNGPSLPEWPAYDPKSDMVMNFGDTPKAQAAPLKDALDFIAAWTASQRK
jgi:para-nitrobenzyl esterase